MTEAAPATWRSPRRVPRTSYAAKGRARGAASRRRAWSGGSSRASGPYLHPVAQARRSWRGDKRKLGLESASCTPLSRGAAWDLPGAAAFEIDADLLVELDPGPSIYHGPSRRFPAVLQDNRPWC